MGVTAIATVGVVSIAEDRARLLEHTEAELGPLDILVNNAGINIAPGITPFLLRKLGYSGTFERIMDAGLT